jgi:hypothetical protein
MVYVNLTAFFHSDFYALLKATILTLSASGPHYHTVLVSNTFVFGILAIDAPQEKFLQED